jgi:hypothetical protein
LLVGDLERVSQVRGIVNSTYDGYSKSWLSWPKFLEARNQLKILFFHGIPTPIQKIILANYVIWLGNVIKLSDAMIKSNLSAVRYAFVKAGADSSIFDDPLVRLTKKDFRESCRKTSQRRLQGIGGSTRQPACFSFLPKILDWVRESTTFAMSLLRKSAYLGCTVQFNYAARCCNVAYGPKTKDKHCLRRCDIVFQDSSDRRFNIPQYYEYLRSLKIEANKEAILGRCSGMVLYFHSSKVHKKVGRVEFLGRRSKEESHFLDLMILWSLFDCGLGLETSTGISNSTTVYNPEEMFFARRHTKGKKKIQYYGKLHRIDIVTATKESAKRLGLDPKCFSSHSWKIASITDLVKQGESDATVRRLGDHSVNSVSTFLYQRNDFLENRPLVLASSGKGLTVADIRTICPLVETKFDSITSEWQGQSIVSIENEESSPNCDSDGSDISDDEDSDDDLD